MGLFDALKKSKIETALSPTGFFSIKNNSILPIDILPKSGSYDDIGESLGYKTFHTVFTFDSTIFETLSFKRHTKEPIFLEVKDKNKPLSFSDVNKMIKSIDWDFEWKQLDFEDNDI
ncbi:MAG TPA: hypothetical protein PLS09_04025 [Paludibacteraceae bacterium]|jgi:hypothetical protein|nr:hypothetical protein [Paludibacteraceae bacterium]